MRSDTLAHARRAFAVVLQQQGYVSACPIVFGVLERLKEELASAVSDFV